MVSENYIDKTKNYLFTEDTFDFVGTLEYALSILENGSKTIIHKLALTRCKKDKESTNKYLITNLLNRFATSSHSRAL